MAKSILIRNGEDSLLLLEKLKTRNSIHHVSLFAKSDVTLAVTLQIDDLLEQKNCPLELHTANRRLWHWELHADDRGLTSVWLNGCTWNEQLEEEEQDSAEKHLQNFEMDLVSGIDSQQE
tara:strand:- start:2424 stop:2783 length:360 start_codon:yes stop_codon:yes gene_type:complete